MQTEYYDIGISDDPNQYFRRSMEFDGLSKQLYCAVFDGHGGRSTAEWCKAHVDEIILENLKNESFSSISSVLDFSFSDADRRLADAVPSRCGCTAAVALILLQEGITWLHTANIGDARIVLDENGTATALTYDHKGTDPTEAKRIQEAGGAIIGQYVEGALQVSRAFGDHALKPIVSCRPYTSRIQLDGNHKSLIIACDGLWDVCSNQDAVNLVAKHGSAQEAADFLIKYALENGSTDNVTVIVVKLSYK